MKRRRRFDEETCSPTWFHRAAGDVRQTVGKLPPPEESAARLLRERPAFTRELVELFRHRRGILDTDRAQTGPWLLRLLDELDRLERDADL
jgi:hypothetical protein